MRKLILACSVWVLFGWGTSVFPAQETALPAGDAVQLVSIDVRNADIRDVLQMLSEQYNLNMVIDDAVAGLVSLRLDGVTLHGALRALLSARGYDYETDNNIFRISTTEVLNSERQIRQERIGLEPLVTEVITLQYLDANDIRTVVEAMLTERGSVSVLERRNFTGFQFGSQQVSAGGGSSGGAGGGEGLVRARRSGGGPEFSRSRTLLITDTRASIERVLGVITAVDTRPRQILIDSRILEVETDTLEDLGIEFDNTLTLAANESRQSNRIVTEINQGISGTTFPSSSDQGIDIRFNKLAGESFNTILHALLQDERTRTLSSPRILVIDGQEAAILVGEQFPIFESTVSDQGTATESLSFYQPVGISLQVVPQITAESNINMAIHPTVSSVGNFVTGSTGLTQPRINIREADTQVMVKNGETIILGGLLQDVDVLREFRIPFAADIPLIGKLFTRTRTDIDQLNLIVFITPRIIEPYESFKEEGAEEAYLRITDPDAFGSLKTRRDNVKKHINNAKVALAENEREKAIQIFERALRLDPTNAAAATYLKKLKET